MKQRSISSFALLLTSVSAIIGSGWLFCSYYASMLAGSSVLLSWLIGGLAIIVVAFIFGEVCSLIPITGSSTRIPQFTHGTVVSFIFSWLIWLSYAAFAPTEVQAVIQYLTFYFPSLTLASGGLTSYGYIVATFLMLLVSAINIYSLRWLIHCNSVLTMMKMIIPVFVAIVILAVTVHWSHRSYAFSSMNMFMPFGIRGIFAAISSGGIIFAFNGFKQAAEMAGEAKNPKFALPFALIGSVVICMIIFLLLQLAFLFSLGPEHLAYGWKNLNLGINASPLAAIITIDKVTWLLPILYLAAILAPMAAAMMYCGSSSRSLYGMSKNGYIPSIFQKLNVQGNPIYAILANFVVGMLMFAPLPGWGSMVAFLSSLIAVTYSVGPITLLALRKQLPEHARVFRLPYAWAWSIIGFYISTLLIYWCGWSIISKLSIALIVGYITLLIYQFKLCHQKKSANLNWRASLWMWVYFAGLALISYLSNFGGKNIIAFGWDFLVLAIFSLFIIWLAMKFKLPAAKTREYVEYLEHETRS